MTDHQHTKITPSQQCRSGEHTERTAENDGVVVAGRHATGTVSRCASYELYRGLASGGLRNDLAQFEDDLSRVS